MKTALASILAFAALASPAPAAVVSSTDGGFCTRYGCVNNTVRLAAAPGERNRVAVVRDAGAYSIRDDASPLSAGDGCAAVNPHEVRCKAPPAPLELIVELGDGDDTAAVDASVPDPATVLAGDGDDRVEIGAGGSTVQGEAGADVLSAPGAGGAARSYVLLAGGPGPDTLTGGGHDETLSGGDGDDALAGGGGNDTLRPGAGRDAVDGGEGRDTFSQVDEMTVPLVLDLATGANSGEDAVSGIEDVSGGDGADRITGSDANNHIAGGQGDDVIDGAGGADALLPDDGDDAVSGGAGDDRIDAGEGKDMLAGGDGDDQLEGGAGRDSLDGGAGDDGLDADRSRGAFLASWGSDRFACGPGDDVAATDGGDHLPAAAPAEGTDCELIEVRVRSPWTEGLLFAPGTLARSGSMLLAGRRQEPDANARLRFALDSLSGTRLAAGRLYGIAPARQLDMTLTAAGRSALRPESVMEVRLRVGDPRLPAAAKALRIAVRPRAYQAPWAAARLELRKPSLRDRTLRASGRLAPGATGRVTLMVSGRRGGRRLEAFAWAKIERGRFSAALRLSKRLLAARRLEVLAVYAGGEAVSSGSATRTLRTRR